MFRLKQLGFKEADFQDLKDVLDEFKSKNTSPTFMRYTVDDHWDEHFYIDKSIQGKNTCINITEFTNKFACIIDTLPLLIEFLGVPHFGDRFLQGQLTKANYDIYLSENKALAQRFAKYGSEKFTENLDTTNKMLEWAYSNLL